MTFLIVFHPAAVDSIVLIWEAVNEEEKGFAMYSWALGFFIAALVAAAIGFTSVWQKAAPIARAMFYVLGIIFLGLFFMMLF